MIKNHIRAIVIFAAIAIVFACIINYVNRFNDAVKDIEQNSSTSYKYICTISEFPYIKNDDIRVFANVVSTNHPADITGYKIQFDIDNDYYDILKYGNKIEVCAAIEAANTGANYGNFDYRNYRMSKNTIAICNGDSILKVELISEGKGLNGFLYRLQKKAILSIKKYFEGDDRALINAMLTGDRTDIDENLTEMYQKAGIYHIVSVSGLHTGIFISVFAYIMALLPFSKRRTSLVAKLSAVVISALLYMFTGYGISITRVILMCAITALCMLTKRDFSITSSIVIAAYAILLFMPYQIFSTAYQLSFLSTYGLCFAVNMRQKYTNGKTDGYLMTSTVISTGSTFVTAPVCAYCFGFISTVSSLANIVVIPLSNGLLISSVIFCILCAFLPYKVLNIIKFVPLTLSKLINSAAELVTRADKCMAKLSLTDVLLIYVIFAVAVCVIISIKRHKTANAVIIVLVVAFVASSVCCMPSNKTKVTFINCLKGEATLVTTPLGKNIMFDCGSVSFENPAEDLFETYFVHNGIKQIDTLYLSYFDDEHTNAVNKLIVMGYIKAIAIPPEIDVTNKKVQLNRKRVINTAERFGVKIIHTDSQYKCIVDGVNIFVAGNNFDLKNKNACAIYKISYGDISFLLSSCLGADGLKQVTQNTKCTVLKLPNYGNIVKATQSYISNADPEYAVITAPVKDRYLSVSDELIQIIEHKNIPIYRTDYNQTITFVTDGATINQIKTRKKNVN